MSLKAKLASIKQKLGETIDDFSYRLSDLASKAHSDLEENSLISFLQGVREINMTIKLNDSNVHTFRDAVAYARKIESDRWKHCQ